MRQLFPRECLVFLRDKLPQGMKHSSRLIPSFAYRDFSVKMLQTNRSQDASSVMNKACSNYL